MKIDFSQFEKPSWMTDENVRPYIFSREENLISQPGSFHKFDWFNHDYLMFEPQKMDNTDFGKSILKLDELAFGHAGMTTPHWVFYDCGVMPGLVAGFAAKTKWLPPIINQKLDIKDHQEWAPISLFIVIPTVAPHTWMAHNLASTNSFTRKENHLKHLGFFTKAFGLWYANIERSYGITQWHSPALKLHPNYGDFELITTYTPLHDYPNSVTYCLTVNANDWLRMQDREKIPSNFLERFEPIGAINPKDNEDLKRIQLQLEQKHHRLYLWGKEILQKELGEPLTLYRQR